MIIRRKNGNNAKDKRRKKLRRTRYGQAPDRHSRKGMKSCLLSGFALFLLVFLLVISFLLKGQLSALVGFVGIGILALAVAGLVCGVRGMYSPWWPGGAAYWCATATRRPRWICAAWRD